MINCIVIFGPTASGKTEVSLKLSELLDIEIISADSRQVYKYLDIGTAKPSKIELETVKHHFIDCKEPDEYYSAGIYGDEAEIKAREIAEKGKIPVIVGGSGLYINALCFGLFAEEDENIGLRTDVRENLNSIYQINGVDELYIELMKVDPISAKKYNDKNPVRIIRALEYYKIHNLPISEAHKLNKNRDINPIFFDITFEREELYKRINLRTELMWEIGLIEETENILNMGFEPSLNALNTVGYKECIKFLNGEYTKDIAIEEMKKNTRRYAKRQVTWFKKYEKIHHLNDESKNMAQQIFKEFKNKVEV